MTQLTKNDDDVAVAFTGETLAGCARSVEKLRMSILLDIDAAGAGLNAEQFHLLGLAALESAQRYFTLAAYAQRKGE